MTSAIEPRVRAHALYRARATRTPIRPFTDEDPALTAADGYAIQREVVAMLRSDGDRVVGYKAGLTSEPMQRLFGIDSPDYGPVLASTLYGNGDRVSLSAFIEPKIEAEIVCRLGRGLVGPGVTVDDARAAVVEAVAGLEIVDSRIEGWRIRLADTIADLASNGAAVLGERAVPAADLDLASLGMTFRRNGEVVATGTGAAALGDPAVVVAWLANMLGAHGVALEPGHLIMTGALHAAVALRPGDVFVAEFDQLGAVGVEMTA